MPDSSNAFFFLLFLVLGTSGCASGLPLLTPLDNTPPSAPASLTGTIVSATQINLSWTVSTDNVGVTGYKVERCQGASCSNFGQIAATSTTTFNDTGLTGPTSYSYRVRATDAAGNLSAFSTTMTATTAAPPDTTPPTAPTNLTASAASSTQINLSWTVSTDNVGVTGYKVERCQGASCSNFGQIAATSTTTFNDTGLTGPTSYSYRVRATDAAGNLSAFSTTMTATTAAPPDTTPPTAPTNLTASAASSTQINLSWTVSTDNVGVTGYKVERCQGASCSNFGQIAATSTTTFNDTGLTGPTSYSYRVRATDAAGNLSAFSTTMTATTAAPPDTTPPTAPTNLTASAASSTQINLSWTVSTDNVGVTGYKVERCQGASCSNFGQIAATSTTTFNDTGLTGPTSYSYRVRATDAAGNLSSPSTVGTATTLSGSPAAPSGSTASAVSATQINLSWTNNAVNQTGFKVERSSDNVTFTQIATTSATTYPDVNLSPKTLYYYRVRATNASGDSDYTNVTTATTLPDTAPPSAPSNLTASAASSTQINLSWTASADNVGATGYQIQRCQGVGCTTFAQIVAPAGTGTTFIDMGLSPSTSYSYQVIATDAAGNLSSPSNIGSALTASGSISVQITPLRGGTTFSQPLNFTANLQNDVTLAGVTWTASGGTFTRQGKTTATFIAPNAVGNVTITATSVADATKSVSATLAVTDLTGVTTYHNDLSRDGANTHEFALTTSTVRPATFGKLFSCPVDGAIYAQPLWVANLTVGTTQHNVIVVATQHESVYAFDADASPCSTLWHANLVDAAHGGTAGEGSVPSAPGGLVGSGFGDIVPEVGITGTPVIDPTTNILYVVSKSVIRAATPSFFQRLHGLDLTNGAEKLNGNKPVTISGSVPGTALDANSSGQIPFDPQNENQRAGLTLVNGVVYIAWGSHEDRDQYHGWIIGYNASTLAQIPGAVFNTTPNAISTFSYARGGIWMAGGAPAADASNNLYLITGNGTYDGITNFSDSVLKVSTGSGLALTDWFTPSDQSVLDGNDLDLGSGGAAVLVDQAAGPVKHLLIGGGKHGSGSDGQIYVLNRDLMGQFTSADSGVVQMFPLNFNIFATPVFWHNNLYVAGVGGSLTAFSFNPATGQFNPAPTSQSPTAYGFPGATPSVSSNGSTNGIVWAIDSSNYCTLQSRGCGPAVLHAYDATSLATELWNSSQRAGDVAGIAVKFTVPTVANGKTYIGTRGNDCGPTCAVPTPAITGELDVYGLLPN
jgi:chitodextrinase